MPTTITLCAKTLIVNCAMPEHNGGKTSLVDDIIARHKAKTVGVRTGAVNDGSDAPKEALQYRKVDERGKGESPLGWEEFIADAVFENIPKMAANDVELCKTVNSYVESIRSDKSIPSDAVKNGRSLLWFELLRTVGWLDEFLSTESVSQPLKSKEFTRLTEKWASDTGVDWRTWFQLLCYLRSAKLTMITNASTKTLEQLYPKARFTGEMFAVGAIMSEYADSTIKTLRPSAEVDDDAPFSERKVTKEQWAQIQRMVLTMYNVLPNPSNLEKLNHHRFVMVNGLSLEALRDYLSSFYYNLLALHSPALSLNQEMLVNGDRVFIDHMLSKDLQNYQYISPDHRTQADADLASADYNAMALVPPKFRMSETFIVNAFKNDRVRLLVRGGVDKLADLGIDSDELFNRVLEVVGTTGGVQFRSNISGDWKKWLKGHVDMLEEKGFNEQKKVIDSNPNTIVLLKYSHSFGPSAAGDDVIGMLEKVIITEKKVAVNATNLALELLDQLYIRESYDYREGYIALLYKGIKLKNDKVREYVLNDEGSTSYGVLRAIKGDLPLLTKILTALVTSFPIEDIILPLFSAVNSEDNAWIEKEVVQAVLKETNVFTIAYSDPDLSHGYEYALEAQRGGFIERADLIELVSMALRTGLHSYYSEFKKLAFDDEIFTAQELSVLFAAQRKDDVTFIDSTFKVLYLAMSKAPEDTAFLIRDFLAVHPQSDENKMDFTDVAKPDPTKKQMVVTFDDYELLETLYRELTGKTIFG